MKGTKSSRETIDSSGNDWNTAGDLKEKQTDKKRPGNQRGRERERARMCQVVARRLELEYEL